MRRNATTAMRSLPHPRSIGAGAVVGVGATDADSVIPLGLHPADVGNDREIPRALDRGRQLALMPRAHAAQAARENLAMVRDKAAERAIIFVVDEVHARLAERTGLLWPSHVHSSSSSSSISRRRLARASSSSDIGGAPSSCSYSVMR